MNIDKCLQNRLDSFIKEKNVNFYKGLKVYVDWVNSQPYLGSLINRLKMEEKEFDSRGLPDNRENQTWHMWEDIRISLLCFDTYKPNDIPEVPDELSHNVSQVHLYLKENCEIDDINDKDLIPSSYVRFRLYENKILRWDKKDVKLGNNTFSYIKQLLKAYPKELKPSEFHDFGSPTSKFFPKHLRDIRRDCVREIAKKFTKEEKNVKDILFSKEKKFSGVHILN